MAPSKPPTKRVRTDAQLERKRQADKLKHQLNRAESKTRLESIEKDVSFIRDTLCGLLGQVPQHQLPEDTLEDASATEKRSPSTAINNWIEYTMASTRQRMNSAPDANQPLGAFPQNSGPQTQPQDGAASVASISSHPNTVVECHCGREHNDPSECLEFTSFNVLYESHKALQERPLLALSIHKNPSLPNMLLHSIHDNSLTKLIGSALRQYGLANAETTCGLYLLVYRLLRVSWLLHPPQLG